MMERRSKPPGIPPWLVPNTPEWNKVMMHNQKMLGMTYREAHQDLWDRRSAYLEQVQSAQNEVVTHAC